MLTVVLIAVQVQQCTEIHVHGRMCIAADIVAVIIRIVEVQCADVLGSEVRLERWSLSVGCVSCRLTSDDVAVSTRYSRTEATRHRTAFVGGGGLPPPTVSIGRSPIQVAHVRPVSILFARYIHNSSKFCGGCGGDLLIPKDLPCKITLAVYTTFNNNYIS